MDVPPYGTPEYQWWERGALDEVAARKEGRSQAGLELLEVVDALARDQDLDQVDIAACALLVYAAGQPRGRRLRIAWKLAKEAFGSGP